MSQFCEEVDALIRAFKLAEARAKLEKLVLADIPFENRAELAQLARRCDDIPRALKILSPNVFEVARPSDGDLIEYASTIRRAGLIHQSLRLLGRVQNHPLVHLHRGFCHINVWQYREAKAELEQYLKSGDPADYQHLVARVNLMSAHIALNEFEPALRLFADLEPVMKTQSPYLAAGLSELRAQIHFFRGEDEACLNRLQQIERENAQQPGAFLFMVKKWRTLCQARMKPDPELAAAFRAEARREGQFENLRFFDLYWALMHDDKKLLGHVYFGSPSEAFRRLIPWQPAEPAHVWAGREAGGGPAADPYDMSAYDLPFGLTLHRLALMLMSDFYQPWSVPRIHDLLFAGEIYDPDVSTKKVYNLIARLKKELPESSPYDLRAGDAGYRLRPRFAGGIVIHRAMTFASPTAMAAAVLTEKLGQGSFSSGEFPALVPVKKSQSQSQLKRLVEDGYAVRLGRGRFRMKAA